jgi:hypothetical protein
MTVQTYVPQQPVYVPPPPPYVRPYDAGPPGPDTTRTWHFVEVATYDASMSGLGDLFGFDIPLARLGDMNSSLSIGAGFGIIFSLAHDSNFVMPIPLTVMWRLGLGTSVELDVKAGGAAYYYSQNSTHDLWSGKFVAGVALRIPLSANGGSGFVFGVDIYVNKLIATLPLIGVTF